ncbi:MAG TPA: hypothetical protein VJ715_02225 [Pyrinomonadaceae bacterium]|nr:hypothetical protein [Pyrinomonadaceae bacterium]
MRRFFVTIFVPNQKALTALRRLSLDIFGVKSKARGESSAGGLLTEENIEKVRGAGFRVEVHEEYIPQGQKQAKRSIRGAALKDVVGPAAEGGKPVPPVQTMNDKVWLKEFNRRKKVQ